MKATDTQREAFHSLSPDSYLAPKERALLAAFHDQTTRLTRQQLSRATGMPINGVCGRVRSLLDKKALEVVGEAFDPQTRKQQEVLALPKRQLELI